MSSKKVAFCFDGSVCTQRRYDETSSIIGEVVSGIGILFRRLYTSGWEIEIYSARCRDYAGYKAVMHWLVAHSLLEYVVSVSQYATDANAIVDARSVSGRDITTLMTRIEVEVRKV